MWQFVVLREHTDSGLETTGMIYLKAALECVEVALHLHKLERNNIHNTTIGSVLIILQHDELKA